jgi:hypothetical protein
MRKEEIVERKRKERNQEKFLEMPESPLLQRFLICGPVA